MKNNVKCHKLIVCYKIINCNLNYNVSHLFNFSFIDSNFLVRFLRTKKFSLPVAQIMLLKYLNLRQTFQHLIYDLDYLEPSVMELINNGYGFIILVENFYRIYSRY